MNILLPLKLVNRLLLSHFDGLHEYCDISQECVSLYLNQIESKLPAEVGAEDLEQALSDSPLLSWRVASGRSLWSGEDSLDKFVWTQQLGLLATPLDGWQVEDVALRLPARNVALGVLQNGAPWASFYEPGAGAK